ncbi:MAG: Hydroxylamine reductase, 6Fe-6S prismane cluster-containing protein [Candidatus Methanohalarchaeum thermophilum]|uniref:Carbon monoxide dehydrogenase n=1 Tax=Methanohalarchaeum thermophilum TaxID=1903181 RepID=A0A1Q6DTF8_METT1|nr:MAG: Hydroxylamine reductase, 6Fe-6S prismane cluster-containing protein [Candidatus Methanohalarchaeum thermophilum]
MEEVSYHDSINEMYEKVEEDKITNVKDRFESQEPTRCKFCSEGIRCNICSNGPCRITKNAERGVCGIDKDGMVMRNFVRINTMGTSAYTYHAKTAAKTLKATAKNETIFEIKDEEKLRDLANKFGIDTSRKKEEIALDLSDLLLEEINRDSEETSEVLSELAPETRKETWNKLGLTPGGPLHELMDVNTSVMTNVDGDYKSMANKALKMGLSTIYGSLTLLEEIQDILFGTASPHKSQVDMGILDENYVNILPNGHEPFIGAALIQVARRDEIQQKAKEAGAKGVRIIGSIETGQELMQRFETDEIFAGLTGNWISNEFVLATGAVDALVADMNCTLPTSGIYAEKYNSKIIPVNKLVNIPGVEERIEYKPKKAEEQALKIIDKAIENYRNRKNKETNIPQYKKDITTGFSPKSIKKALGGSLDPLIEHIKQNNIRGIVAMISCTTLKNGPQDEKINKLAEKLIKENILVLSAGCGNAGLQVSGLTRLDAKEKAGKKLKKVCNQLNIPPVLSFGTCTDTGRIINLVSKLSQEIGTDPTNLPVAVSAPEYMEQKATIAAIGAIAYGLYTHVSPTPPVTGSENVVSLLTEEVENLTGGKLAVGEDPEEIKKGILEHLDKKREKLGI